MSNLETLRDGLIEELKDLYSAESQLVKALPKMEKRASNESLKECFAAHLGETKEQIERLDQISKILGTKLSGKTCVAMKGLIEEGKEVMEEESENEALLDALLVGAARRVEHYEMAAYSTACAMAKALGEEDIVELLESTFAQESEADRKLADIAESEILAQANTENIDEFEEEEEEEKKAARPTTSKKGEKKGPASRVTM